MNAEEKTRLRRFPFIFLLSTDGISCFLLVPLVVFHVWLNLDFNNSQLSLLLKSTAAAAGITLVPVVIITAFLIKPIVKYFNTLVSEKECDDALYQKAFTNLINLPLFHGLRAFFCYAAGFIIIVAPTIMYGSLNTVQMTNLLIIAFLVPVFAAMIYFSISEILVQRYMLFDCLPRWITGRTRFRMSLSLRMAGLSLTSALLPFLLLLSYLLKMTMPLNVSKSGVVLMAAIIGIIGLVISAFMTLILIKSITLKMFIIHDSIEKVKTGDLCSKLYKISTIDEFQNTNLAIAKVRGSLYEIVQAINSTIQSLGDSSADLTLASAHFADTAQSQASSTEQMNATIEELSAGMDRITDNTTEQNRDMNSLIASMKDFSLTMESTASKTGESMKLTDSMKESATSGEDSLKQMIDNINSIRESSDRMNSIVEIINDISDKINLLSLNAAIESARAGEAGRGFAVVADEISKLADQTASSIKEIDGLIRRNNEESRKGITNVDFTKSRIDIIAQGMEYIVSMMNTIASQMQKQLVENQALFDMANRINEMTESISASTTEHKKAMDEIVRAVTSINDGTQTISSGAEGVSAKTQNINSIITSLKSRIAFFRM